MAFSEIKASLPSIGADDPCLCGRGQPAGQCCLRSDGRLVRAPTDTRPRGSRTGEAEPKCYAGPLNDCDGGITREHYFSRSVLEQLGPSFRLVGGAHRPEGLSVTPSSLTGKVLCERHNSILSGLDSEAARLFSLLLDFRYDRHSGNHLFAGEDIERWILKALCGALFAGVVSRRDGTRTPKRSPIPVSLLRVLFGEASTPPDTGLWITIEPGAKTQPLQFIPNAFPPDHKNAGQLHGGTLQLVGVYLTYTAARLQSTDPQLMYFRPPMVALSDKARLVLSWESGGGQTGPMIDAVRPTPE